MINWTAVAEGELKPDNGMDVVFWARGSARVGYFDSSTGYFFEYHTGLVWSYPKVTHWSATNEPEVS